MFSTAFEWGGFAVSLNRATAIKVAPVVEYDGAYWFDNGRQYIDAAGGVGMGGGPVDNLPAAWAGYPLPAGAICPLLAQLALLRGEVAEFSAATGRLTIGGRMLVGTAGSPFRFSGGEGAAQWAMVNRKRGIGEINMAAGLPEPARVVMVADRAAILAKRAARVVSNAARVGDAAIRAAMLAEANWYLNKWSL